MSLLTTGRNPGTWLQDCVTEFVDVIMRDVGIGVVSGDVGIAQLVRSSSAILVRKERL